MRSESCCSRWSGMPECADTSRLNTRARSPAAERARAQGRPPRTQSRRSREFAFSRVSLVARIDSRDQPDGALVGKVRPGPLRQDQEAIPEADEIHDVNEEPCQP